jgi:hypothetical protein
MTNAQVAIFSVAISPLLSSMPQYCVNRGKTISNGFARSFAEAWPERKRPITVMQVVTPNGLNTRSKTGERVGKRNAISHQNTQDNA